MVVSCIVVVLAAVGLGALVWAGLSASDHPDSWDPLVADLAAFIEDESGLAFEHPVQVNFLSPEEYRAAAGVDDEVLDEDREYADQQAAVYRALGMASGEQDLTESTKAVWGEGTAAFFDTVEEAIYVNSEVPASGELDPQLRATVVHELTHAWQSQHAEVDEGADWTTERSDAEIAVREGDAMVMEWAYAAELSEEELDELIVGAESTAGEAEAALEAAGAGDLVPLLFSMPYDFGPAWVDLLLDEEGTEGLVAALGPELPTTASILGLSLDGAKPVEVDGPALPDGADEIERDTWGAFSWVVPLAGATDAMTARAAVIGWAGDSVLISSEDDSVCVDAAVQMIDGASADAFEAAATEWLGQLPAESTTSIERDATTVSLRTCDPGTEVEVELAGDAEAALAELAMFNDISSAFAFEGMPSEAAQCVAGELIEQFGVERLNSDDLADPEEVAALMAIEGRCR